MLWLGALGRALFTTDLVHHVVGRATKV